MAGNSKKKLRAQILAKRAQKHSTDSFIAVAEVDSVCNMAAATDQLKAGNDAVTSKNVLKQLLKFPAFVSAGAVAVYESFGAEPDTTEIIRWCEAQGKQVLVPDRDWSLYRFQGGDISQADFIIVPALAVDRQGHRLGRGGGWYDRVLVHKRLETPVVALVYSDEVLQSIPHEPHDIPVDYWLSAYFNK
jgi:5-formyltetrahydrofolate cyclo-ligase